MKLLFLTLTVLLSINSQKVTAQDVKVSAAIANAFRASFTAASDVQWKDAGDYYKADFVMNGQYVTAYYDAAASLVAVTKNITAVQLPVTLQAKLKQAYEDYWISDLFEVSNEGGTTYYVTVEDNENKITLKSIGNAWSTYKKQRKA